MEYWNIYEPCLDYRYTTMFDMAQIAIKVDQTHHIAKPYVRQCDTSSSQQLRVEKASEIKLNSTL